MSNNKKKYSYTPIEELELESAQYEEDESAELLSAYARIPMTDGGCGADGGAGDGGPPYC